MNRKQVKRLEREYARALVKYTRMLTDLSAEAEDLTKAYLAKEAAYASYTKALQV